MVVVRWSDVVRRSDVARRSDEVCRSELERRSDEEYSCVLGNQVKGLSHISVEDGQRPMSLDGDAKHKQASSQGLRLECTLFDQAIGTECRLRQWGKALEEESSRANDR